MRTWIVVTSLVAAKGEKFSDSEERWQRYCPSKLDCGSFSGTMWIVIDWEDLAQRQIAETQDMLPQPIRARAMEVPVFFADSRSNEKGACLGIFEGYSLNEGPPARPDEMPRITLFLDTLAEFANYRKASFVREVRTTYLHELGHYFGWNEEQVANAGLG